jgi:putative FmdB family regulatory protein
MPRYDYQCAQCGKAFEVQLSFAEMESARPACPKCGSRRAKRQIGTGQITRKKSRHRLTLDQAQLAAGMTEQVLKESSHTDHEGHEH